MMKQLVDMMPIYTPDEEGGELDTCWTPAETRKEKAFWYLHKNEKAHSSQSHRFTAFVQRLFVVSLALFLGACLLGAAV